MLTLVLDTIETYACAHTSNESNLLRSLFKESFSKTRTPDMMVGHIEGAFLKFLVRLTKARKILEIGTFTGYSALAMAEGMPDDGSILTLDIDPKNTEIAKSYWSQSPHGKKIKLILGEAMETLKTINEEFDIVFIDADKINYLNYWKECIPKVKSGGCILADNVLWKGYVLNPRDEESRALDSFNKYILSDSRVEAVMLTIRDGLTLAYKK